MKLATEPEKLLLARHVLLSCHLQRLFFFATDAFQRNRSQPIAPELDVLRDLSWRIDHLGRVEDGMTADEGGEFRVGSEAVRRAGFDLLPVSLMTGRQGLAHARRAIANPHVAVAAARIAELGKALVFRGDDKV